MYSFATTTRYLNLSESTAADRRRNSCRTSRATHCFYRGAAMIASLIDIQLSARSRRPSTSRHWSAASDWRSPSLQHVRHHATNSTSQLLMQGCLLFENSLPKGVIASKIKHAIKHKTSPTWLAQLWQPSLAFCFSLQPMTAYRPVLDGTPYCRTCFKFYCMFYFTCDHSLTRTPETLNVSPPAHVPCIAILELTTPFRP